MPDTLKLFIVFFGMQALTRLRVPLGLALVAGGLALDLWSMGHPVQLLRDMGAALVHGDLWLLLATTVLLLEFGRLLGEERNAQAIMTAARSWGGRHGRAVSLMIMPAAVGLVPMPGGALVSAPLVDRAAHEETWSAEWKSTVNYWFRHVWEYWWPLYPVVIVTLSIFHIPTWQYMAALMPFSVTAMAAGYFFLVRPHMDQLAEDVVPGQDGTISLAPMWIALGIVVACTLLLPLAWSRLLPDMSLQTGKLLAMLLGMAGGLAILVVSRRDAGGVPLFSGVFEARSLNQVSTLGGVMVFQSLLQSSGMLPKAGAELMASGIPLTGIVALLPFIAGLITGIASGFAGMAFPLVVGLMSSSGGSLTPMATLALAFGFGYAGMMLSPVHLCLVLTRNYFSAHLPFIYRHMLPCVASTLLAAGILFAIFRWLGV